MEDQKTDIALIRQEIGYVRTELKEVNNKISNGYVPLSDFNALKARVDLFHRTAAYFLIIVGLTIVGAILKLVLIK